MEPSSYVISNEGDFGCKRRASQLTSLLGYVKMRDSGAMGVPRA